MRASTGGAALLLLAACGTPAAPAVRVHTPEPEPRAAVGTAPEANEAGFRMTLRFQEAAIAVEVVARGEGLERFTGLGPFSDLEATDAAGALEVIREGDHEVRFDRVPAPPLTLRYRITAPDGFTETVGLEAWFSHVDGRALLLPPDAPSTSLRVEHVAEDGRHVACTLGAEESHALTTRPIAIAEAAFAAGRPQSARFDAREGRDYVVAVGPRAYDVRWVGAELALIRSAVNEAFGGVDADEHPTLLIAHPAGPRVVPFAARRSGRGVRIFAREDAPWTSEARLPVTQVMARRFLGGMLQLVGPAGEPELWLSLGVTRYAAQEILTQMGTLTSHERAVDLTRLEGALALDDGGDGAEARALRAMARGALYAAGLDARLAARDAPPRTLSHLLFPLLRQAQDSPEPLQRAAFEAALAAALGEAEVARFRAEALGDAAPSVPAGAFGPCLRLGQTTHRRFALGFDAPPVSAAEVVVRGLVADGPAARAGITEGLRLRELTYRPGDPSVPARAVTAEEPPRTVTWTPSDRSARGRAWIRAPRIDEERCAR